MHNSNKHTPVLPHSCMMPCELLRLQFRHAAVLCVPCRKEFRTHYGARLASFGRGITALTQTQNCINLTEIIQQKLLLSASFLPRSGRERSPFKATLPTSFESVQSCLLLRGSVHASPLTEQLPTPETQTSIVQWVIWCWDAQKE